MVGDAGNDYHQKVILPGVVKLLGDLANKRVLDVACGQGVLCRHMAREGAVVTGVDAAESLLTAARERSAPGAAVQYLAADVRKLSETPGLSAMRFDAATCVLAVQNFTPLSPVWQGIHRLLLPRGRLVLVFMHPCFRVPKHSGWGWDQANNAQYRRVDHYLSSEKTPIAMHPGAKPDETTMTYHRPLQAYVNTLASAGFMIDHIDEWPSHRISQAGPKKAALDASRREIPLFMALRAVKMEAAGEGEPAAPI